MKRTPQLVKDVKTDERRVAWGITADGQPLVATPRGLHAPDTTVLWVDVERVSWNPPTLTLIEASEREGTGNRHTWELEQDHRLAETVRAAVTSTIGWSDRRALRPRGHVRLVGRRIPGQDALRWQTVFEAGTDPADPSLRAQADQMVDDLRRTIG